MIYSDAVMEYFLHPRHVGVMNSSDADVGTGKREVTKPGP